LEKTLSQILVDRIKEKSSNHFRYCTAASWTMPAASSGLKDEPNRSEAASTPGPDPGVEAAFFMLETRSTDRPP
jgi:hypothetical protein